MIATTDDAKSGECLLPRAVAYAARDERLLVACEGGGVVLELDARAADPMRAVVRRHDAPRGPVGVAVADREGIAVVLGRFDREVRLVPLAGGAGARAIASGGHARARSERARRARVLPPRRRRAHL